MKTERSCGALGGLRRGSRFEHRHYLDPDYSGKRIVGLVTRVARGIVYYRPDYGLHDDGTPWLGGASYFPLSDASRYVARILPTPNPQGS